MVEMQHGVEEHGVAALRLSAPNGVNGEHHDVSFARWNIDHGGATAEFGAGGELAAVEQVAAFGKAKYDAWAELFGNERAGFLRRFFRGNVRGLPGPRTRIGRGLGVRPALRHVSRIGPAASGGAF